MPEADLMQALAFTADDLRANRAGQLSQPQQDHLRAVRKRNARVGMAIVFAFVLVATGLLFAGQRNESSILGLIGILMTMINALPGEG